LAGYQSGDESPHSKGDTRRLPALPEGWAHSPARRLPEAGAYMVTAATYGKAHHFRSAARLELLQTRLLELAAEHQWEVQAWAVFSNHYHFIAHAPVGPASLSQLLKHLHADTAREVNRQDGVQGRKVWFQFWDTLLTYERSYFARLNYVHNNAVKHGLAADAEGYPWCSAAWFANSAEPAFYRTVSGFKTDRLNLQDDFAPLPPEDVSSVSCAAMECGDSSPLWYHSPVRVQQPGASREASA
jgi:putative transposase